MKKIIVAALIAITFSGCKNQISHSYLVNAAVSKAEWKGSAPDHYHVGSFKVTGDLESTPDGVVTAGDFIIPIASIQDFDLPDPVRQTLLTDLKDNFFKIATHPEAKFHITMVEPYGETYVSTDTGAINGTNYKLTGDFSMLGQTHTISFPAKINVTSDSLVTEAKFDIDRRVWGMDNYSDPQQKLYILPNVNIHLKVQASRHLTAGNFIYY